ncbi:MAG: hypothetical protein AAF471_02415 [Myxococcota bacterium]
MPRCCFLSIVFLVAVSSWAQQPGQERRNDKVETRFIASLRTEDAPKTDADDSLCRAACACGCIAAKKETLPAAAPKMRVVTDVGGLLLPPLGVIGFRYEAVILPWLQLTVPVSFSSAYLSPLKRAFGAFGGGESVIPMLSASVGLGAKFVVKRFFVELDLKAGYAQIINLLDFYHPFHEPTVEPAVVLGYQHDFLYHLFFDVGLELATRFHPVKSSWGEKPFKDPLLAKPSLRFSFGYWW